jgi:hypothetical protein
MLTFCDPTAAAVADITAFTRAGIVARYSGTVAELFADFNTGTADRTRPRLPPGRTHPHVFHRRAVSRDVRDPGQRRHHP